MIPTTATSRTGSAPVPALPAAGAARAPFVASTRWRVTGGRARQQAAADAALAAWRREPWPSGLLALDCFLSTDGTLVWFLAGWESAEAHQRGRRAPRWRGVTEAAARPEADVALAHAVTARAHGPFGTVTGEPAWPGCTVLVTIDTDQAALQPVVAGTIAAHVASPPPGSLGGRLFFATDGRHVLNYAEWTSEEVHREAVGSPVLGGRDGIFAGMAGIRGSSMNRYQPYRRFTAPA